MFKSILTAFIISGLLMSSNELAAQTDEVCPNPNLIKDTTKKSIKSIAEGEIGGAQFAINYHSPGVRKRIIWAAWFLTVKYG